MKNEFILDGTLIDCWIDNDNNTREYVCHIIFTCNDNLFYCDCFDSDIRNMILQCNTNDKILVLGYIQSHKNNIALIITKFTIL